VSHPFLVLFIPLCLCICWSIPCMLCVCSRQDQHTRWWSSHACRVSQLL